MHVDVRTFWLPKAGNAIEDYEDAFWSKDGSEGGLQSLRIAVADGATEASFSARWANLLVTAYGSGQIDPGNLCDQLPALQETWQKEVSQKVLPWYAEEKLRSGAFATLVGVTFNQPESGNQNGTYRVTAVGDSCFFHVRAGKLVESFPLYRIEQFTSRPMLVSSVPENNTSLSDAEKHEAGHWESGDVVYLMTDALACWFLGRGVSGAENADVFADLDTADKFTEFVAALRTDKTSEGEPRLKNDDVTLIRCELMLP